MRALIKQFEGPVIQNFSQYVQAMLVEYGKDPSSNWRCKDTAIYLVTTLAARAKTQKVGSSSSLPYSSVNSAMSSPLNKYM